MNEKEQKPIRVCARKPCSHMSPHLAHREASRHFIASTYQIPTLTLFSSLLLRLPCCVQTHQPIRPRSKVCTTAVREIFFDVLSRCRSIIRSPLAVSHNSKWRVTQEGVELPVPCIRGGDYAIVRPCQRDATVRQEES